MKKLSIYKPSKELLEEIRRFYPTLYWHEDRDIVILNCLDIIEDPYYIIYTCILSDKHIKISFTVSADDAQKIHVCKRRYTNG